jgi:hypothetical protein
MSEIKERPIDKEETEERLWELYVVWCEQHGYEPKLDSFQIWKDENFD